MTIIFEMAIKKRVIFLGFDLKTYLLMRWWGPDALAVCRAHQGLPVGFLLLWYSVLFTVESLSLLYPLVILIYMF